MKTMTRLLSDESGSATLWNLFWITGICALLGLGLDTTAAVNTKARLQEAADAAAHAAVMDVFPLPEDALSTATVYARLNMPDQDQAVRTQDVTVGYWDPATRTFATENVPHLDAVRVVATRDEERGNALATFLLHMAGFDHWDINAAATAAILDIDHVGRCRRNGFLAGDEMEKTSINTIVGATCLHGQNSFKINQNNIITCGSQLSTPEAENWKTGTPPSGTQTEECSTDYQNLSNDQMIEQATVYSSSPSMAQYEYDNVKKMLDAFIATPDINDPFNAIPPYITGVEFIDVNKFNNTKKNEFVPGTLYVVSCGAGASSLKPSGILQNIGIYTDCAVDVQRDNSVSALRPTKTTGNQTTDCDPDVDTCETVSWEAEIGYYSDCAEAIEKGYESYPTLFDTAANETYRDGETVDTMAQDCAIEPGATGVWDNVFLFTTANEDGNRAQKSVTFPNNMQIGRLDYCEEGGGARIYAGGSIETPSGAMIRGSHFVVLGDVKLAAKSSGTQGTTVEAVGDIQFAAQGTVGGCPAEVEYLASDVVITVRPLALVE